MTGERPDPFDIPATLKYVQDQWLEKAGEPPRAGYESPDSKYALYTDLANHADRALQVHQSQTAPESELPENLS